MSFLQPWMLLALPLISIPIIIHLINQRRYQTVPWAAMMFLLQATQMSSGYTKLRQWLILLMRTLAIAGLIFFTARPLASGLMGLIGSQSNELAIVIVDRSPSMQEQPPGSGLSKLQSGVMQLGETLRTLRFNRLVTFDSSSDTPHEFDSIDAWTSSPTTHGNGLTSDLPGLLERALAYIRSNNVGSAQIWICSDLRESDWSSHDGRWAAIRDGFLKLQQDVRIRLLDLGATSSDNRSIRVTQVKKVPGKDSHELLLSFRVDRAMTSESQSSDAAIQIPVEVDIEGSRFTLNVDLQANKAEINDYRVPLVKDEASANSDAPKNAGSSNLDRGWGSVRIPSDTNPADNVSYFVFETPPARKTIVVSSTPNIVEAIELCAAIAPEQSIQCDAETVAASALDTVDWNEVSLVVWQDQLPSNSALELLEQFAGLGGQILFLPPENPSDATAFGLQWLGWEATKAPAVASGTEPDLVARVEQWRNDSELLGNTLNGAPLPVGQLGIKRVCRAQGDLTPLASLTDRIPLFMRVNVAETNPQSEQDGLTPIRDITTYRRGIYACATTPSMRDSTLAVDGVVLYIAIQRILATGSQRLGTVRTADVGQYSAEAMKSATPESADSNLLSNQYASNPGVFTVGERLIAQNRRASEDNAETIRDEALDKIFDGLQWSRIGVGTNASSLVQEIWRWFVILMLAALLIEAILSMPRPKPKAIAKI